MKVLQIYNHVPSELQGCIDSVQNFAVRVGAEYIAVTEGWDGEGIPEAWSNRVRMEYGAKYEDLLYLDWDYLPDDNFEVGGDIPLFGSPVDSAFWTGKNTEIFQSWLDDLNKYYDRCPTAHHERARLHKIMRLNPITDNKLDRSTYKHLLYHRIRERQNVTNDR